MLKRRIIRIANRVRMAYSLNVGAVPVNEARAYADDKFKASGKSLGEAIPDFDKNYALMQRKVKKALNVPRIDMPVIEPSDMKEFSKRLAKGAVDVFAPYAKGKLHVPKNLSKKEGEKWVELGYADGKKSDDVVKGKWTRVPVGNLKPTQSQIWLENIVGPMLKFGLPGPGSPVLNTTVIVSKDGYILDGHHRFGQAMLADPKLKIKALVVPLPIKLLLKIGRTYGLAIGNIPKA